MTAHSVRRALLAVAAAFAAGGALGACTEKLDSGAACPSLCPGQSVPVRDTLLGAAVAVDTTIAGYPAKGDETYLLAADQGSTLQSDAVVRFDSLPAKYNKPLPDTGLAITQVFDSKLRLIVDSTVSTITAPVTIEVFDVGAGGDESDAAVESQFTAARRIGSRTFPTDSAKDTLRVPLSDSAVLNKIVNKQRLRLGIRVTGSAPVKLGIYSTAVGVSAPVLSYDPTPTTDSVAAISVSPLSKTPAAIPTIASSLRDYTIIRTGARPLESDALAVGGLPARRTYLRFDVPKYFLDSTTIVRATLLLTQRPVTGDPAVDTAVMQIVPAAVLAGADLTDIARSANVLAADSAFNITQLAYAPKDSGVRVIELGLLMRTWRTVAGHAPLQHAIVLRSRNEGLGAGELRFFSTDAPADTLRPRLRITYVPRVDFGIP